MENRLQEALSALADSRKRYCVTSVTRYLVCFEKQPLTTSQTNNREDATARQYRSLAREQAVMGKRVSKMKRLEAELEQHKVGQALMRAHNLLTTTHTHSHTRIHTVGSGPRGHNHAPIHSLTHPLTHSPTHSPTHSLTHSLTH